MNPFSEVRAPPESDERRRIRALSHRTAPPRPRHTDRTPRRTRNIAFARSRRFCTRLTPGGSGNVASKNRPEEGSGEVRVSSTPREVMPSATKNATAVDAGSIREDMWNFGDEVGLDEFLSNIPDGDGVSALGGVEKGKRTGTGWKMGRA